MSKAFDVGLPEQVTPVWQIDNLRSALEAAGMKTTLLAFWDNVVVGVKYREGFVHKVLLKASEESGRQGSR